MRILLITLLALAFATPVSAQDNPYGIVVESLSYEGTKTLGYDWPDCHWEAGRRAVCKDNPIRSIGTYINGKVRNESRLPVQEIRIGIRVTILDGLTVDKIVTLYNLQPGERRAFSLDGTANKPKALAVTYVTVCEGAGCATSRP